MPSCQLGKIHLRIRIDVGLTLILLFLLVACNRADTDLGETPAPTMTEDEEGVSAQMPNNGGQPGDGPTEGRQVVIWAPEFWMATEETPAGQVIENAVTQFEQTHGGTKVEIHTKAETGTSDILNLLRSAQKVAPTILPDAVLMDAQDVWHLVELGMVPPLADTIELRLDAFYPFARASVLYNDDTYGIPYVADLLHAGSIDPTEGSMPGDWDVLLAGDRRYLFPAEGPDGMLSMLLQYVGAGGKLTEADVASDMTTLTTLLEFYADGVAKGVIPVENAGLTTLDATWDAMDSDISDIADTSANIMLRQSETLDSIRYAPSPTQDESAVSIARTWVFVILTSDPGQREQVLELVQVLLDPNVHGQWSKFTRLLPTSRDAAATWAVSQPYAEFLLALLESEGTQSVPNGRPFAEFAHEMQAAQQAVLTGQMTPEEAAAGVRPTP